VRICSGRTEIAHHAVMRVQLVRSVGIFLAIC
jgi:hypothetical protein